MNPLFAIRNRLRDRGPASISQLAAELQLPADSVTELLAHWQRRGQVEQLTASGGACASGCGGGCGSCSIPKAPALVAYRWHTGS